VELNKEGRRWVEQTLKKLSLEEKVGQMLSVRYFTDFQNFSGDSYVQFRDQMRKYHVGSVVLTVHVDGSTLLKNLLWKWPGWLTSCSATPNCRF